MNDDSRPGGPRPDDDPPADHLTRTLQALPRVQASPTFTDRVLTRIASEIGSEIGSKSDQTSPERDARKRTTRAAVPALLAAAAAAAGAVLLTFGAADPLPSGAPQSIGQTRLDDPGDLHAMGAELDQLRREQRDLAAEVESLRTQQGDRTVPVIYVGQSAGIDLVLDLAHFQEHARPAGPERKP